MSDILFVEAIPPSWRDSLRAAVESNPQSDAGELAGTAVASLTAARARSILAVYARAEIKELQREHARKIEQSAREASRERREAEAQADQDRMYERFRQEALQDRQARFTYLFDNPHDLNLELNRDGWASYNQFEDWCVEEKGPDAFQAWRAARDAVIEQHERDNPSPVGQAFAAMQDFVTDLSAKIRFEVTAELLDSVFATGDGSVVTWREASVEQHEQRIEMLTKMAAGTAETAAMHARAIEMIKESGAATLGQLPLDTGGQQ
jgi:hypothetical protein